MQRSFSVLNDDDSDENVEQQGSASKNSLRGKTIRPDLTSNVGIELEDSDSEENSTSPKRNVIPGLTKFSPEHLRKLSSSLLRQHISKEDVETRSSKSGGREEERVDLKGNITEFLSDSDPEESDDDKKEPVHIPGEYDYKAYENLEVDEETKEIFQYIVKYTPQHLNLDFKFKPFIPEYLPAVGDIDAFLKVIPPETTTSGANFNPDELQFGLIVLDEPAANQSDPALLHLQLRAASNVTHSNSNVVVKKIDNVERNTKTIDKWIKDISDLHKSKSSPIVKYSEPMPDVDDLMQAWPDEVENHLKEHGFPYPDSDTSLSEYIDTVCGIFEIPVRKNKIESLHLLFSLYAAVKNSQLYKATNSVTDKDQSTEKSQGADQLVLE